MKNRKINFLKKIVFILVIPLLLWSCEDDEILKIEKSQNNFLKLSGTLLKGTKQLKGNTIASAQIKKLTSNKSKGISSLNYDFTIDTTSFLKLKTTDFNSYTFQVYRDNLKENILENYVLTTYLDGTFTQFIVKYYKLENGALDLENPILTKINDNNLLGRGADCQQADELTESVWGTNESSCIYLTCSAGANHAYGNSECEHSGKDNQYSAMKICTGSWITSTTYACDGGGAVSNNNIIKTTATTAYSTGSFYLEANELITALNLDITNQEEIDWINSPNNTREVADLFNFGKANNWSPEALSFVILAIEALDNDGIDDGEVDFDDKIIYNKTLDDYPCHKNLIDEAFGTCANLSLIVQNAFGTSENTNLIFRVSNSLPSNARTSLLSVYNPADNTCNTFVTLSKSYIDDATDISIARTIIHESLHAIFGYMFERGLLLDKNTNPEPKFEDLVEAYIDLQAGLPTNLGVTHHTLMTSFINEVSNSLSAYGSLKGYSNSLNYYKIMAWGGLTHKYNSAGIAVETELFKLLVPNANDRMTIVNTHNAEKSNVNNLYDGSGNIINPKGNEIEKSEPCN